MSSPEKTLLSEEDIRTRVVATWLADHGFTAESISVEHSFEIRLGRGIFRVGSDKPVQSSLFRPRADVVVRSNDGRNLLVVEVKAPGESLGESVKEQGISYARLLRDGGIAPFVVITNGDQTKIYDSISGELVSDTQIPTAHPYAQNGFRVTTDDIALRSEALETFISLSPSNLIEFCRAQVLYRMRPLRSEDPFSGKKYIPKLYIDRNEARQEFNKRLDDEKRRVVILAGEPQVGKTNFVCHTVEERLEAGIPCLFYPAIGIQKGLLEEIQEDFEWVIHESSGSHQIITKLTRILKKVGQRLVIFIDGWNEASQELVRAIDKGSERLACDEIQIVVSFTNVAANRLLLDDSGNPSYIADAASIDKAAVPLFEIAPEKLSKTCSRVEIQKYNSKEIDRAYEIYADTYNVEVPSSHSKSADPLILRIGMEVFSGKNLPEVLDEPELLGQIIQLKAQRVVELEQDTVMTLLTGLADEIFLKDAPISQFKAREKWGMSATQDLPKGLFESALLAKVFSDQKLPSLDFYYGRERDFLIAYWTRNWIEVLLEDSDELHYELSKSASTKVGEEALRWFLRQPKHFSYLQTISELSSKLEPIVKRVVLSSARLNLEVFNKEATSWIKKIINRFRTDTDMLVRIEVAKLIAKVLKDEDELVSILSDIEDEGNLEELIAGLLEIDRDFSFGSGSAGQIVLDTFKVIVESFKSYNFELCIDDHSESNISYILINLMQHQSSIIRQGAAKALGYTAPHALLRGISDLITSHTPILLEDYIEAIELAVESLRDIYLGDFGCPGAIQALSGSPNQLYQEYIDLHKLCKNVVTSYADRTCSRKLLILLEILQEEVQKAYQNSEEKQTQILQLPSPLDCLIPEPQYSLVVDGYYQFSLSIEEIVADADDQSQSHQ